MTDKKTFGSFIKSQRNQKGYSQKDLAEMLYVTEGAVSKWERGVSYPDITLISDICRVLDISEHELITASTDMDTRKMKQEARKFRTIQSVWFWMPTVSYALAAAICFICNLAVNRRLSWFFIVFAALLCAYSFVPTFTVFFEKRKLHVFVLSSYLSISLLLFTCALYTDGLYWFLTAAIGILIGYALIFVPILLSKSVLSGYKFLITFALALVLTVLLELSVYMFQPFMLNSALIMTLYGFLPLLVCAVICTFRLDGFYKAAICTAFSSVVYYFAPWVENLIFGVEDNHYQVNFSDWNNCLEGNINLIALIALLILAASFMAIAAVKSFGKRS